MTPVINPWVFYLMSVVDDLQTCLLVCLGVCCLIAAVATILYSCAYGEDERKLHSGILKKVVPASIAIAILLSFIPGSTTITKMLVAQNVTYERVEMATDTVQSVYEDIMRLFEEEKDEQTDN